MFRKTFFRENFSFISIFVVIIFILVILMADIDEKGNLDDRLMFKGNANNKVSVNRSNGFIHKDSLVMLIRAAVRDNTVVVDSSLSDSLAIYSSKNDSSIFVEYFYNGLSQEIVETIDTLKFTLINDSNRMGFKLLREGEFLEIPLLIPISLLKNMEDH